MYGYIYKTTNLINSKIYIGKKKGEFTDTYLGSGKYLRNAIKKYGIENFVVEVIEYCENLEIQNEREQYWIAYYRKQNFEMYNIANGGDGGDTFAKLNDIDRQKRIQKLKENSYFANLTPEQDKGIRRKSWETRRKNGTDIVSEDTIIKMSLSHKGKHPSEEQLLKMVNTRRENGYKHSDETKLKISNGNKGKTRTLQTRFNISNSKKGKYTGKDNPFYNKKHTKETKLLIGSYNKDRFKNRLWIHNKNTNKRVLKDELQIYLSIGYELGRISWKGV